MTGFKTGKNMKKTVMATCIATAAFLFTPVLAFAHETGYSAILSCPAPPPFSAPQQESACTERYTLAWQGQIPDAYVGRKAMDLLGSGPGWNIDRLFCGGQTSQGTQPTSPGCNGFTVGRAPDGSPALQMFSPKGVRFVASFQNNVLPAGVTAACASVDIWVPIDWKTPVPNPGVKWGLGLWGGGAGRKISGGTPPSEQDGFSVRLEAGSGPRPHLYAYHYNRGSGSRVFGTTMSAKTVIPRGRWVTIEQEIVMEKSSGGTDGIARLYMDGKLEGTLNNMEWGKSRGWTIKGYMFSDLWGGHIIDHQSPVDQTYWYRNLRIYK
jgi:hypothetical protein